MKFVFILDPIHLLDPGHDSTVALMEAAQALGHEVWIAQAKDLGVVEGKAQAALSPVKLAPVELKSGLWVAIDRWYELGNRVVLPLESMDAVFMRTDPPVNIPYLYATYILDYVDPAKTLVVNNPKGLRSANEKMYALQFRDAMPETVVTQDRETVREFVNQQGRAILKPLGGMAGEGILFLETGDRNLNSMVEISTQKGRLPVMIQQFLPEAKNGDKRIILLDGEPIGAVNRIPTGDEFRGNMAVGGRVERADITDREREICTQLAPSLQRDGLYFVGIDIIGGYLTEVNVTSPTGIREIDRLDNTNLGKQTIEWVKRRVDFIRQTRNAV